MSKRNEHRPGYKKTKVGWIPDDWDCLALNSIASNLRAGVSVNSHDEPAQGKALGVLKTSAVSNGYFRPSENKCIQEKEIKRAKVKPVAESIIISRMNTRDLVGANAYICANYSNLRLPDRLWLMQVKDSKSCHPRWLGYVMASPKMRSILSSRATGTSGSMKNISKSAVLSIKVQNPPFLEQKKIAEILSAWDRAIEQTQKLVEAKKQLKKGLMQQLLTGRARFNELGRYVINENRPGYQDRKAGPPDGWGVNRLADLVAINPDTLNDATPGNHSFYYIDLSSVNEGRIQLPTKKVKFGNAPSRARRKLVRGDILLATVRPYLKGFAIFNNDSASDEFICSTGFAVIRASNNLDAKYIYQYLFSHETSKYFHGCVVGSSYPALSNSDVGHLKIYWAPLGERKKIAKILFVCDQEIEMLNTREVALVKQKRGLMQKLLTGEVRVKVPKEATQ